MLPQAEAAFRRALDLDPDLSSAHDLAAYVDAELGRAPEGMARLLRRAATRRTDPGVFAGLVTTARYAGLYDASLAAHQRAKAIDAAQGTSVQWTHFMLGDYEAAIASDTGPAPYAALISRIILGRVDADAIRAFETKAGSAGTRLAIATYRHLAERDLEATRASLEALHASGFADPEGWYLFAIGHANMGAHDVALEWLERSVKAGYGCHAALIQRPQWQPLRGNPTFERLVVESGALVDRARRMFDEANGAAVLGMPAVGRSSGRLG
jgi:tetratricopeptide (TPR) repeat protein